MTKLNGEQSEKESEESNGESEQIEEKEEDKEEKQTELKFNLLNYLTNNAGYEIKDVIKMSLKERLEKYQAQKQKEEEEFNNLSSYETDSIKSEGEYEIDAYPVEVYIQNKF